MRSVTHDGVCSLDWQYKHVEKTWNIEWWCLQLNAVLKKPCFIARILSNIFRCHSFAEFFSILNVITKLNWLAIYLEKNEIVYFKQNPSFYLVIQYFEKSCCRKVTLKELSDSYSSQSTVDPQWKCNGLLCFCRDRKNPAETPVFCGFHSGLRLNEP